ncbi:hypothetical protein G6F16_000137 [Rhizopus arrhizus]|nr:hypothetical protein G6F23_000067 [Rhizopus arrhizus]KAG0770033.1 hypothetical protein G6F24_000571 [Rhizopus arrhizus]KAG0797826.1 hypothetical protein G6F21_000220 [Rhizopus arrhizus]KAG0801165.1 hypothetical protein G6F22_001513 [Rhizopus arrhizus]KAG0819948.1 hypothetical protein G6F20_000337 [Rhizopus arrhizus]
MKISILATCTLFLTGSSLATSFPNDMFYHHHPEYAEEHAKSLYQVNNNYAQPQGYGSRPGPPPRNAYNGGREQGYDPGQRYAYRANYNGNGISKRNIKYTEDGAIDWSSMAEGAKQNNNRNLYANQGTPNNYNNLAYNQPPYGSNYYDQGPRQLYNEGGYNNGGYNNGGYNNGGYNNGGDNNNGYNNDYNQGRGYGNGYSNYVNSPNDDYNNNNNNGGYKGQYSDQGYNENHPYTNDNNYENSARTDQQSGSSQNPSTSKSQQGVSGNNLKFAAATSSDTEYNHGQGTFYDLETHVGLCGKQRKNTEFVAALNSEQMGSAKRNNPNCGKNVEIIGPNGKSVKAAIVDDCKSCKSGDLDLSPAVFEQLGDFSHGSIPIKWKFT